MIFTPIPSLQNSTITFRLNRSFTPNEYLALARHGVNTEYCPRRFHAIIMRLRSTTMGGSVTVIVFSSGRLVMTGIRQHLQSTNDDNNISPQIQSVIGRICRRLDRSLAAGYRMGECGEPDGTTPPPPNLRAHSIHLRNLVGARRLPFPLALLPLREWMMEAYRTRLPLQPITEGQTWPIRNVTVINCVLDQTQFPGLRCALRLDDGDEEAGYELTSLVFRTGRMIVTGVNTIGQMERGLDVLEQIYSQFPSPNSPNH